MEGEWTGERAAVDRSPYIVEIPLHPRCQQRTFT